MCVLLSRIACKKKVHGEAEQCSERTHVGILRKTQESEKGEQQGWVFDQEAAEASVALASVHVLVDQSSKDFRGCSCQWHTVSRVFAILIVDRFFPQHLNFFFEC